MEIPKEHKSKTFSCFLVKLSALKRFDFEGEYYVANFQDLKQLVQKLKKCMIHVAKETCLGCSHCRYGFTSRQDNCEACFNPDQKEGDLRLFIQDLQTIQHGFDLTVTRVSFQPSQCEENPFLLEKVETLVWSLEDHPRFLDTWVIRF